MTAAQHPLIVGGLASCFALGMLLLRSDQDEDPAWRPILGAALCVFSSGALALLLVGPRP